MKTSSFPIGMHLIMNILSQFPTWYIKLVGGNWFASAILSNFPGPRETVSFFRKYTVHDILFWSPHLNGSSGIGISMLTYRDTLRIGVNVDSGILPSQKAVHDLCLCIEEEMECLQSTIAVRLEKIKLIWNSLMLNCFLAKEGPWWEWEYMDEEEIKLIWGSCWATTSFCLLNPISQCKEENFRIGGHVSWNPVNFIVWLVGHELKERGKTLTPNYHF